MTRTRSTPQLLRTMGLFSLVVYGVGDMVGAGIYGTVGDAAVQMGNAVWLSFLFSMVAAVLTGLSYACLASRYPRAGGAAYVTQRAFHVGFISYLIGLMVTASGLTSMATSTNVFTRTVLGLTTAQPEAAMQGWPWYLVALSFLAFLTFVRRLPERPYISACPSPPFTPSSPAGSPSAWVSRRPPSCRAGRPSGRVDTP